ncbi:MAG: hypothetical protein IKT26_02255 [Bacteroidaceae bacterium]|nr:hypothetical protein [Bacteroidaceae bacterium]
MNENLAKSTIFRVHRYEAFKERMSLLTILNLKAGETQSRLYLTCHMAVGCIYQ